MLEIKLDAHYFKYIILQKMLDLLSILLMYVPQVSQSAHMTKQSTKVRATVCEKHCDS